MKRMIVLAVLLLCILPSCQKENSLVFTDIPAAERSSVKVQLCHTTGNGAYVLIEVNENAVNGHLQHGDAYPNECLGDGLFLDQDCQLIDVSMEGEDCANGLDDNCNGLVDDEDEEFCSTCPCFDLEMVLAADNLAYYNFEVEDCGGGPFVGFSQPNINYGVNVELNLALSPTGDACFNMSDSETISCKRIIVAAQEELQLPNFCNQFTSNEGALFFKTNISDE